jgi:UDP-glucose:tetrahydrobiopterin glucosyltransferase
LFGLLALRWYGLHQFIEYFTYSQQEHEPLRLLIMSTSVGALGSGLGGGVELTVKNLAIEMRHRGHEIQLVAPAGSELLDFAISQISGNLQTTAQTQEISDPIAMPADPVLANMWSYARQEQVKYDLIFNIAYDWLPFYLTPWFQTPIAHFISMGSLISALDREMGKVAIDFPGSIGVCSRTQAETFDFAEHCRILGGAGLDLGVYEYRANPSNALAFLGRISPEKGLEDALAAAKATGLILKIMGKVQDEAYWQQLQTEYAGYFEYCGFLDTAAMQQIVGDCQALLMTPRWVEAFGNVAIEALACGVPVISYARGGPTEIVRDGKTGFLVEPDSVAGLVEAIGRLGEIDRSACRKQAEQEYSLSAWGDRLEDWFASLVMTSNEYIDY